MMSNTRTEVVALLNDRKHRKHQSGIWIQLDQLLVIILALSWVKIAVSHLQLATKNASKKAWWPGAGARGG